MDKVALTTSSRAKRPKRTNWRRENGDPYVEGWNAQGIGVRIEACPYDGEEGREINADLWRSGWRDRQEDQTIE